MPRSTLHSFLLILHVACVAWSYRSRVPLAYLRRAQWSSHALRATRTTPHDDVLRAITDAQAIRSHAQFVPRLPADSTMTTLILLDLTVRDVADLDEGLADWPIWPNLRAKLTSSKQTLMGDKFIYTHDVGVDVVQRVSIARIPTEDMYQKLTLAKALVGSISTEREGLESKSVLVTMLGNYGEQFVDVDMCEALQAASEVGCYQMPNFKGAANSGKSTLKSTSNGHEIIYVAPAELIAGSPQVNKDSSGVAERSVDDDAAAAPWHYFQQQNNDERKQKISALEEAMLSASRSSASNNDEGVLRDTVASSSSHLRGSRRTFESLVHVEQFLRERSLVNQGTNIARGLASLPPNLLNPESYTLALKSLSTTMGWTIDEWNVEDLAKIGAGAFCAVCQGNARVSGTNFTTDRLIRLRFSPVAPADATSNSDAASFPSTSVTLNKVLFSERASSLTTGDDMKRARPVVLVGKGVTYDTGGVNVKSANSMKTMKHDMSGSGSALGVFMALTQMNTSYPVECWLAICENNAGMGAYRPDDVVTAVTGETIEVVHTDAEGRMLLADVLALASRKIRISSIHGITDVLSPQYLLDFATLTGTCVSSLSNRYIGAFSNRRQVSQQLIDMGDRSGERVWPFPCDADFDEDLKSDVADVLQCRQPTEADHIYAFSFLKRFVSPSVPWVHFDLASAHRPGGLGHVGSDFTGSGVRAAIELLSEECPR